LVLNAVAYAVVKSSPSIQTIISPATATPALQTIHTWRGAGTEKTDAFSMVGTWHIQWSCSDQSSQYLTINLYDYDTGIVLESWQNPCTTDQFDKTVTSTGIFQIEGVIADSGATYHVAVLQ